MSKNGISKHFLLTKKNYYDKIVQIADEDYRDTLNLAAYSRSQLGKIPIKNLKPTLLSLIQLAWNFCQLKNLTDKSHEYYLEKINLNDYLDLTDIGDIFSFDEIDDFKLMLVHIE